MNPEVAETLYGLQTSASHGRQWDVGRYQEIAECLAVASPDTSSQLVQLAKTEVLGVVDYYSVDIWHIYAALYYGCGNQHVIVMVGEVDDGFFKLLGWHLSVSHYHTGIGHKALHLTFKVVKPFDAVVDHEYLTVARQLEVNGFLYYVITSGVDRCDDRVAVWRGSVDG